MDHPQLLPEYSDQEKVEMACENLMEILIQCHAVAGYENESISRLCALAAFDGSGSPIQAIASGLLSTGFKHAPITQARESLLLMEFNPQGFDTDVKYRVSNRIKIVGIGNSFFKDRIDPAFQDAYNGYCEVFRMVQKLEKKDPGAMNPIETYCRRVNAVIRAHKPTHNDLYPNAALITAGIANLLNMDQYFELWPLIAGRSRSWLKHFARMSKEQAEIDKQKDPSVN